MKFVQNTGTDRVIDLLRPYLKRGSQLGCVSPTFSLFVLAVTLRAANDKPVKGVRLAELVHRAVPYPVVLLLHTDRSLMLSLAHKRWAQNEAGKVVLEWGLCRPTCQVTRHRQPY